MKRRVFTKAFFFGLVCSQALAADPLPTLQETPMFAERGKSGALPPVAKRIPDQPWVVKRFPGDDAPGRPDGQPLKVEIIDERTIKYSWDKPNPYFIESQARAAPLFLFRPAHYLKKFHAKYTDPAEIAKAARGGQQGSWVQIHRRLDVMFNNVIVDLPSHNP